MRSAFVALAGMATLLLAAACGGPTTGTASPGGDTALSLPALSATSAPARPSSTYDVPRVTTALDTAKYQSAPCSVVTPAQVRPLNLTQSSIMTYLPPGTCSWNLPDVGYQTSGAVTAGFVLRPLNPDEPLGLAGIYDYYHGRGITRLPDIAGQPAVQVAPVDKCDVYVGLTDNLAYHDQVNFLVDKPTVDPCTLAREFMAAAMATMKSGA